MKTFINNKYTRVGLFLVTVVLNGLIASPVLSAVLSVAGFAVLFVSHMQGILSVSVKEILIFGGFGAVTLLLYVLLPTTLLSLIIIGLLALTSMLLLLSCMLGWISIGTKMNMGSVE